MKTITHKPALYWKNFAALLALLGLTWWLNYVDLGVFNLVFALIIAMGKVALVVLFFMHIKGGTRLLWLAATVGVIWLLILFGLTSSDYLWR
jgi:cytochrome c oxidase subunit 4